MGDRRGDARESRVAARARRQRMLHRRRRTVFCSVLGLFALVGGCQFATGGSQADQLAIRTPSSPTASASQAEKGADPTPSRTAAKRSAEKSAAPAATPKPSAKASTTTSDRVVPNPKMEVKSASGHLVVVSGTGKVWGHGPLRRYLVEVEAGLPEDPQKFAAAVESTLGDPRSWGHDGALSFQRVDHGPVDFRVTLASPKETDKLCAVAGLKTDGAVSCYNGTRSVINQNRWETAVPWFDGDLVTYRYYVINHEVGHALGHHHEHCAGPGQLAPVMQEQTYTLEGCRKNGWPFPG